MLNKDVNEMEVKTPRKEFDFVGNFKYVVMISLAIFLVGIVINIFLGTKLDTMFKGGTDISYSYTGTIDEAKAKTAIETAFKTVTKTDTAELAAKRKALSGTKVKISTSEDLATKSKLLEVSIVGNISLTTDQQKMIETALQTAFKDNKIVFSEFNSVSPTVGISFFQKSLYAVALACFFVILYVAFRFRKIGGLPAGVMALVSLFHDIIIVYFMYVILRIPLNDNFIAVILTILGYSLNDTIVIYDRIRENGKIAGKKGNFRDLVNHSINQSFKRSVVTVTTVFLAITIVYVVALVRGLDTVISFALPMSIGVLSGCYSSIFVATPLWVFWQERKDKKASSKKAIKE